MFLIFVPLLLAMEPDWQALRQTGLQQESEGLYAQAEASFTQAIRAVTPSRHLASLYNNLGHVQISRANYLAAESSLKRALALYRQHDPTGVESTFALNNLAILYHRTGRLAEAESVQRHALAARQAVLGLHHPDVANAQVTLAALLAGRQQYAGARELLESALATFRRSPSHALFEANLLVNLANVAVHEKQLPHALTYVREACRLYEVHTAPGHPSRIESQLTLAHILLETKDYAEAERAARQAVNILRATHPDGHPTLAHALSLHADALSHTGRKAESRQARAEAEAIVRNHRAANPRQLTVDANSLARKP